MYSLKTSRRSNRRDCSSRDSASVEARTMRSLASRIAVLAVYTQSWARPLGALSILRPGGGEVGVRFLFRKLGR